MNATHPTHAHYRYAHSAGLAGQIFYAQSELLGAGCSDACSTSWTDGEHRWAPPPHRARPRTALPRTPLRALHCTSLHRCATHTLRLTTRTGALPRAAGLLTARLNTTYLPRTAPRTPLRTFHIAPLHIFILHTPILPEHWQPLGCGRWAACPPRHCLNLNVVPLPGSCLATHLPFIYLPAFLYLERHTQHTVGQAALLQRSIARHVRATPLPRRTGISLPRRIVHATTTRCAPQLCVTDLNLPYSVPTLLSIVGVRCVAAILYSHGIPVRIPAASMPTGRAWAFNNVQHACLQRRRQRYRDAQARPSLACPRGRAFSWTFVAPLPLPAPVTDDAPLRFLQVATADRQGTAPSPPQKFWASW